MIQTVGNLSTKGVSFFWDEGLREEIPPNDILRASDNYSDIEFYIGIRESIYSTGRVGTLLCLEENYKTFFLDMVQEVDGNYFRNYDNILEFSAVASFDVDRFFENLLSDMLDKEFYRVLQFISLPHMGTKNMKAILARKMVEPNRIKFGESATEDEDNFFEIPPPTGFWEKGKWPPPAYYLFFTDYFVDPRERERVSIWEQFINNPYVVRGHTYDFANNGFATSGENYNYVNDIYPEQKELMDYRWRNGGFDITIEEFNSMRGEVFNVFKGWYKGASIGGNSLFYFQADEPTVFGFTGIRTISMSNVYERDKHILAELLGPLECLARDAQNRCVLQGYGDSWSATAEERQEILFNIHNPEGFIPNERDASSIFTVLSAPTVANMSMESMQSEATYSTIKRRGPNAVEAVYAVDQFMGKMGGQKIFNNGEGNEHRYFISFRGFLAEQGWSISDFIEIYNIPVASRKEELMTSLSKIGESNRVKEYSEFYDVDRRAPFDNIEHYIPIPIMLNGGNINVEKKSVVANNDGTYTVSNIAGDILTSSDFKLAINKDEFVSKVTSDSCRILMSEYMKIKVKIKFKDTFPNIDKVRLRMFTSDFTFLNEREFKIR